jgi:prepilin-type N-terminal cleavage/methylation domain-containing protein
MFRIFKKKLNNQKQRGMTLIELLVALVIFSIITGVVLFNYGDFNASLTMQNLADDIALTVRRAQSYAIGVRGREGSFQVGYGVHFGVTPYDPTKTNADDVLYQGSNKSFILYKDDIISGTEHDYTNTNNSCGGETSCLEMLYIKSSDYISQIGVKISEVDEVGYLGGENPSGVSIFFKRPSPEPHIYVLDDDDNKYWGIVGGEEKPKIDYVKIEISSLKDPDSKKYITISNTGQISVSNQDD